MEAVLSPAQMRAADDAAIAAGTPGAELMDRAAHACAVVGMRALGGAYGKRVIVVAGKGNNGGDGIAAARHLAASGVSVTVLLLDEPSGDGAFHLDLARIVAPRGRFRVEAWSSDAFDRAARSADLVVDAILGTGFSGTPRGAVAEAIEAVSAAGRSVLAIDIPSGVDGSDGSVPGAAVRADITVAVQCLKVGHLALPGAMHCGRIDVADIGIPLGAVQIFAPGSGDVENVLPPIDADTHKYRVGALGVLAGSSGMTGAAVLTARGAIRSGAGLVILGVPASTLDVIEGSVIEAVKVPLPDIEGRLDAKAVDEFADRLERCRAFALGPGLGRGPQAVALVRRALDVTLPLVIDGDGLWALAEVLRDEPDVLSTRSHATVLTPHGGEFAYLSGDPPGQDHVSVTRDLADRLGAVVHLKGRRAVTAAPGGTVWVNTSGNPGAATGGTGDVLTGIVGSLVAQGAGAADATWAGAYLHGLAADIVARRLGSRPLVAHDLPDALPAAFREIDRARPAAGSIRTVLEPIA